MQYKFGVVGVVRAYCVAICFCLRNFRKVHNISCVNRKSKQKLECQTYTTRLSNTFMINSQGFFNVGRKDVDRQVSGATWRICILTMYYRQISQVDDNLVGLLIFPKRKMNTLSKCAYIISKIFLKNQHNTPCEKKPE